MNPAPGVRWAADAEREVIAAQAFLDDDPLEEPGRVDDLLFGIRLQSRPTVSWSATP